MSHIKRFNEFRLNEADDFAADPAAAPADPADPAAAGAAPGGGPAPAPVTKLPHPSDIITTGKKFFRELTTHIQYWFKYGRIGKLYTLDSVKGQEYGLKMWLKVAGSNGEEQYSIRAEINVPNPSLALQKIEDILLDIHVFNPDQTVMKETEVQLKVKDFSEKRLRNEIKKVLDAIVKKPKSKLDVRKFTRKEPEALGDDIY